MPYALDELAECNDRILSALREEDPATAADLIRERESLVHRLTTVRIDAAANLPLLQRIRTQGEQIDALLRRKAEQLQDSLGAANALRSASAGYAQAAPAPRSILHDGLSA